MLVAVAVILGACETAPPPREPAAVIPPTTPEPVHDTVGRVGGGTLRMAIGEPRFIVPADAVSVDELLVVDAVFDSLTRYGVDLTVEPAAATAWEATADALTWTFQLRDGALFHDGTPVTADDFKQAWEIAARSDVASHHLRHVAGWQEVRDGTAADLSGVEVVDATTLMVRLSRPFADFPSVVAHPALGPVPGAAWHADPAAFRQQPIGNGPFRAADASTRARFIRLARFERWRNGPRTPALGEVVLQVLDPETGYVALQQGRVDVSAIPDGALAQALATNPRSRDGYTGPGVLTGLTPSLYLLGFNVTVPPFDDPEVRRAISLAIDRDELADTVLEGTVVPARSFAAPVLPGGRGSTCFACRLDRDAAAAIFAERGIARLTLEISHGGGHERIARAVREDLAAVGVTLAIRREPFDDFLSQLEEGAAVFYRFGWIVEYPILDDALVPLLHSGPPGERNYSRYASPEVDALFDQARATVATEERIDLYRQAEDIAIRRDMVVVPLFYSRLRHVVADRVEGFHLDPMGFVNLADVRVR